jgi:hypothetical protein
MERLVVPTGRVSCNIMMLSPVSRPRSFNAKDRPGVVNRNAATAGGYTKPFATVMSVSSAAVSIGGSSDKSALMVAGSGIRLVYIDNIIIM